jgi:hypothetical protein
MRKSSCGLVILVAMSTLLATTNTGSTQANKGLFTNEQRTLACQQYVNSLYPPTTGQMDRQRESAMRACLRMKHK